MKLQNYGRKYTASGQPGSLHLNLGFQESSIEEFLIANRRSLNFLGILFGVSIVKLKLF